MLPQDYQLKAGPDGRTMTLSCRLCGDAVRDADLTGPATLESILAAALSHHESQHSFIPDVVPPAWVERELGPQQ